MDESGFEQEVIRAFGYTPVGKPCIDIYNYQKTKRTNVIGALYQKSLFAVDIFLHNINWQVVYDWFKYNVIPKLGHKCVIVIVMDMSEDKAKHCFARVQEESYARVPDFIRTNVSKSY